MSQRSISRAARLVALGALTAALAVSCIRPTGPGDLKRQLSAEAGVRLDKQVGVTVTRSGIWLARKAMAMSEEPMPDLRGLRRVEVGVYEVADLRRGHDAPVPLGRDLFPDWHPLVSISDDESEVRLFVLERGGEVRKMLLVVAEPDEWVLVRLSGRLERVLEQAMEFAFDEADRPDLYAQARDEARAAREDAAFDVSVLETR